MNKYIGCEQQLYGVEEMRLVGGKGDGMRLYSVRNGSGLEFTVSLDRCADISRVSMGGVNLGYFAPCGYVSPKYYDRRGSEFLKSFTAGFFTTCGLTAVGSPCTDDGEELGLHGNISNTPCESAMHYISDGKIHIKAVVRDASLFSHQLLLEREYICPLDENAVYLTDRITNIGPHTAPLEVLYHCNMGYPMLSEHTEVNIPSEKVTARNEHAESDIERCFIMEEPQKDYEEMCYYHKMNGKVTVSAVNKKIGRGVEISYDTSELKCFTEWKMMGEREYVLGLEPGNCLPDGRDVMRKNNMLEFISPGETREFHIKFNFMEEKQCL